MVDLPHPSSLVVDERRRMTVEWYKKLTEASEDLTEVITDVAALEALFSSGAWTPTLTFVTPGDLSVAYTTRLGRYVRIGTLVALNFNVLTSTFTHTTASGELNITGLPFAADANTNARGAMVWGGITKAGYTQVTSTVNTSQNIISFRASGSGVAVSSVVVADVPSGGTVDLRGSVTYFTT